MLITLFFVTDYTHYSVLLSRLLTWNLWLHSPHCFSSLTTLTMLLYSLLLKLNNWLRSLRCFTSLLLNGNLWLHSLCSLTFTTIKKKSLTTLTTLFYFTTIKRKSLTTLTMLFYFHDYSKEISDSSHYAVLLSRLLKWNLWLSSSRCLSSLTTLTMLF